MPEPTDKIRATIAERLIAIGATDDDGPGLFEWHPCTDREACTTVMDPPSPCPCAGRPYLSDDVWTAITEAFRAAGRLLPEGGQTRTEWGLGGVEGYDVRGDPVPYDSAQGARDGVNYWRRHGVETRVVSREVREFDDGSSYSGPWVAVDPEEKDTPIVHDPACQMLTTPPPGFPFATFSCNCCAVPVPDEDPEEKTDA